RARRPLARAASGKASSPTPLGLAPERQSGLRALIIAPTTGRGKGAVRSVFASLPSSIHASRVRSVAQAHRGLYTRTCGGEPPEEVSILALLSDHRGATQVTPFVRSSAPTDRRHHRVVTASGNKPLLFIIAPSSSPLVHASVSRTCAFNDALHLKLNCPFMNLFHVARRTISGCQKLS
ncbi:hypothetical protein X777_03705, partial [Ooceraea biroi]